MLHSSRRLGAQFTQQHYANAMIGDRLDCDAPLPVSRTEAAPFASSPLPAEFASRCWTLAKTEASRAKARPLCSMLAAQDDSRLIRGGPKVDPMC